MNETIFFYDFETTGANALKDRPVQIGLSSGMDPGRIILNMLTDPCMPIHEEAEKVHGISSALVYHHPDYLMGLYTMMQHIQGGITKDSDGSPVLPIISGYNITTFDTPMAEACFGSPILSAYPHLDVLDVMNRYYPMIGKKKLTTIYKVLFDEELTGAHGAIEDCLGTARVLNRVCSETGKTPLDLVDELREPIVYDIMPIGKHMGTLVDKVPASWAQWMRTNATNMRPDLQKTVDYILDERGS